MTDKIFAVTHWKGERKSIILPSSSPSLIVVTSVLNQQIFCFSIVCILCESKNTKYIHKIFLCFHLLYFVGVKCVDLRLFKCQKFHSEATTRCCCHWNLEKYLTKHLLHIIHTQVGQIWFIHYNSIILERKKYSESLVRFSFKWKI